MGVHKNYRFYEHHWSQVLIKPAFPIYFNMKKLVFYCRPYYFIVDIFVFRYIIKSSAILAGLKDYNGGFDQTWIKTVSEARIDAVSSPVN
jgi:hypothetical protein